MQDIIDDVEDRELSGFVERLRKGVVHSGMRQPFPIAEHGVRRHRHNGSVAVGRLFGADTTGRFEAIHFHRVTRRKWGPFQLGRFWALDG